MEYFSFSVIFTLKLTNRMIYIFSNIFAAYFFVFVFVFFSFHFLKGLIWIGTNKNKNTIFFNVIFVFLTRTTMIKFWFMIIIHPKMNSIFHGRSYSLYSVKHKSINTCKYNNRIKINHKAVIYIILRSNEYTQSEPDAPEILVLETSLFAINNQVSLFVAQARIQGKAYRAYASPLPLKFSKIRVIGDIYTFT